MFLFEWKPNIENIDISVLFFFEKTNQQDCYNCSNQCFVFKGELI